MPVDAVRIERVKLKDLVALADSAVDAAKPGDFIPITKHRAAAMARNPNADPDDVALLLAKEGDRNVGFFGVMPVMLQHDGKLHKVHWLTTWGVAPEYLGKGLGSRLMEEALALDVDLAIVGSKPARRVSAKYGFVEAKPLEYVEINFGIARQYNPISLVIRLVQRLFRKLGVAIDLSFFDRAAGAFFQSLLWPLIKVLAVPAFNEFIDYADLGVDKVNRVTEVFDENVEEYLRKFFFHNPTQELIEGIRKGEEARRNETRFYRDSKVVNWMLGNPWVVERKNSQSKDLNYGFTDWRPSFKQIALRVSVVTLWTPEYVVEAEQGYATFQLSKIRGRRTLKALDYRVFDNFPTQFSLAVGLCRQLNAEVIEGPVELANHLPAWTKWLVRRKQRTLQLHPRAANSPLAAALPALRQTYVDGDTAFT